MKWWMNYDKDSDFKQWTLNKVDIYFCVISIKVLFFQYSDNQIQRYLIYFSYNQHQTFIKTLKKETNKKTT